MTVGANILIWKKVNSHCNYHCLNIQESVGNAILRDFLLLPIESCLFMKQSKNNSLHFKSLTGRRQCQYLRKIKQKLISLILFSLLYLMFFSQTCQDLVSIEEMADVHCLCTILHLM